ncbi:molecular chaperone GrpE [Egbenema bharatensis]|uniref:molecular chaperone GrpE n=1 Tax=Egbenema bharatensis TaxID=3463334 RepID=UPI003A863FED
MNGLWGHGLTEMVLDLGAISFVLALVSRSRRSLHPSTEVDLVNQNSIQQPSIADLQNQCRLLQVELHQQQEQLKTDFRDTTFELLQPLLTSLPTLRQLIKVKPDLPAHHLIALLAPLAHWLQDWGIETIGTPWEQVPYDPQLHQADADNYIPGEPIYIRFVGYRTPTQILHPAQISRTLPPFT